VSGAWVLLSGGDIREGITNDMAYRFSDRRPGSYRDFGLPSLVGRESM